VRSSDLLRRNFLDAVVSTDVLFRVLSRQKLLFLGFSSCLKTFSKCLAINDFLDVGLESSEYLNVVFGSLECAFNTCKHICMFQYS
jgi:hypothetical protein